MKCLVGCGLSSRTGLNIFRKRCWNLGHKAWPRNYVKVQFYATITVYLKIMTFFFQSSRQIINWASNSSLTEILNLRIEL